MKNDLERFVIAQNGQTDNPLFATYQEALLELQKGQKSSHWMWFVLPQLLALGTSDNAIFYGLADVNEALEYANHPVLGSRLKEVVDIALKSSINDAQTLFGKTDADKFQASLTLFALVTGDLLYQEALNRFFEGQYHPKTYDLLQ